MYGFFLDVFSTKASLQVDIVQISSINSLHRLYFISLSDPVVVYFVRVVRAIQFPAMGSNNWHVMAVRSFIPLLAKESRAFLPL